MEAVGLKNVVPQNFRPKNIYHENLLLEFSLQKILGLFSGGRGKGVTPPEPYRVKNIVNHLIYVSKAYIPNLRPLGAPLQVEKFVLVLGGWWVSGGWVVVGCV